MVSIPKPVMVPIEKLTFHPTNVKKHDSKQLHDLGVLYDMIGFTDPIIADKDNLVWAGNGSLEEAKAKGMTEVPVVYMPEQWSEEQKKVFMLMDNKINESPYIAENIQIILQDVDPILFENFEMNLDNFEINSAEETEETPEPSAEPKAKLGEIYQLGKHKIMCGDATKDLDKLLDKEIDLLFTDPPYGLGGYAGRSGKFESVIGDDLDPVQFYNTLPKNIPERYIWGNWFNIKTINEIPRDVIIWKKNNFGMGKGYRGQYEICMYFGSFSGSDTDVWEVKKDFVTEYKHPTQKPVELPRRAILNSTKINNTVLDCYLGSGSTLIACEQTNRVCYGMEIDPGYIDVIIERWENFTGLKAKLISKITTNQAEVTP